MCFKPSIINKMAKIRRKRATKAIGSGIKEPERIFETAGTMIRSRDQMVMVSIKNIGITAYHQDLPEWASQTLKSIFAN